MKKTTIWIIGAFALTAIIYLLSPGVSALIADPTFWTWRKQFILFSGIASLVFMSLVVVIAVRPSWLDKAMDGLDKGYGLHKWAGICSAIVIALHYLGENGPKWAVGWGWLVRIRGPKSGVIPPAWETFLTKTGVVVGEWTFYIMLIMVIIALIKIIPYNKFRILHKIFPIIYIAAAYHTIAMLFKSDWWQTPAAYIITLLTVMGTLACLIALCQRIGTSRKYKAAISQIQQHPNGVVDISLNLANKGLTHKAGQFAFVRFAHDKEPHPFTIASSGSNPNNLRFAIKSLGDFTGSLKHALQKGQTVEIEGPYGCFDFNAKGEQEVWIAGGIGITPFMARLQQLTHNPDERGNHPIHFWYCTSSQQDAAFPDGLETLCQQANVTLHRISAAQKQYLNADIIKHTLNNLNNTNFWFCGPQGFAKALNKGLQKYGVKNAAFHNERFSMR